jgi:hypothetical protein
MANLTGVTRQLQNEKQCVHGEMERLNAALAVLGTLGAPDGKAKRSRAQGAEAYVSGRPQENRGGPACTLGKIKEKPANQVIGKNVRGGFCNIARIPPGKGVLCNKLLPTAI